MPAFSAATYLSLLSRAICYFRRFENTKAFVNTYDVLLIMFSLVDLPCLQRLTQVNRSWARLGRAALRERVFLELSLHIHPASSAPSNSQNPLKETIMEFLTLLDRTHSMISGSTALAVCMQRTKRASEWMDSRDLDIFTPVGMAESIVNYLVGKLDYTQAECLLASSAGGPGFPEQYDAMSRDYGSYTNNIRDEELRTVTRLVANDGRRIDVMESATTSALLPLASFPLTNVMNYITGTTLVVCFPWQTLVYQQAVINPDAWPDECEQLQRRYIQRGWPICEFEHGPDCVQSKIDYPYTTPASKDSHSLVFCFNVQGGEDYDDTILRRSPRAVWIWGYQELQSYVTYSHTDLAVDCDLIVWNQHVHP